MKKVVLLTFVLALLSTAVVVRFVRPVVSEGTIYIRSDGSVEGTDKIQHDGDIYNFTANIYDEIVVERNNIIIDGNGYTLQGTGAYDSSGIYLAGVSNVTIRNMEIKAFYHGIQLTDSSNNSIHANDIVNNTNGILSWDVWGHSDCNSIFGNNLTNNVWGIVISGSKNSVYGNNIANNDVGNMISTASENSIYGNNIKNNDAGIHLYNSSDNLIFHNNFINNTHEVIIDASFNNKWDYGYPSGGNYWSDYAGADEYSGVNQDEPSKDGIIDVPYVIDVNNQDEYPLVDPYTREIRVLYYELLKNYNNLTSDYNDLKADYELTRNLTYVFIMTTIIFLATTAYLTIRKPKVKPRSETT